MGIISSLNVYGQNSWQLKAENAFSAEDKAAVERAEVVPSQFGKSVCFHLKSGGMTFIPLSNQSNLGVGQPVNMETATVLTLGKQGEADIYRVNA